MNRLRRWAWPVVLVAGLVAFYAVREATVHTGNPNFVPSLILLGAAVMPCTFVAFVSGRRLEFGVTGGTVAFTALVGGVIGVVTAGVLEYDVLARLGPLQTVGIGLIEEAAKLILPLILVFVLVPRLPGDGLLLGVASGAGFAVLETMGYAFVSLLESQGSIHAVDDVLFVRGLLSPGAHMAWTGLTATALWAAAQHRWRPAALFRFLAVYLVAVALHVSWDGFATPLAYGILTVISLGLLGFAVHRAAAASRPLTGRPAPGLVTPAVT